MFCLLTTKFPPALLDSIKYRFDRIYLQFSNAEIIRNGFWKCRHWNAKLSFGYNYPINWSQINYYVVRRIPPHTHKYLFDLKNVLYKLCPKITFTLCYNIMRFLHLWTILTVELTEILRWIYLASIFGENASRWQHSSSAENPLSSERSAAAADEITFVEVASTVVPAGSRQSDPVAGGRKRDGWMSMPYRRHRRPTLWYAKSRDIQAARRPALVSHSVDPRVENHGRHDRIGLAARGEGGREKRWAWDGTVSRAVAERVPVINSHRPPADGLRIEFTRCIHMLERIGRLFKRVAISATSPLLVTYTSPPTYSKSAQHFWLGVLCRVWLAVSCREQNNT